MTYRRSLILGAGALTLTETFSPATYAMLPIAREEVLCRASYVFVGRVLAASYSDCSVVYERMIKTRQVRPDCKPKQILHFRVYVKELLSLANTSPSSRPGRNLGVGEVIEVVAISGQEESGVSTRLPTTFLSSEELTRTFVQKDFVFSLRVTDFEMNNEPGPWVNFWAVDQRTWAVDTLKRRIEGCPAPL